MLLAGLLALSGGCTGPTGPVIDPADTQGVALVVSLPEDAAIDGVAVVELHDTEVERTATVTARQAAVALPGPGAYGIDLTSSLASDGSGRDSIVSRAYVTIDRSATIELRVEDRRIAPGAYDWGTVWPQRESIEWLSSHTGPLFETLQAQGDAATAESRVAAVAAVAASTRQEIEATEPGPLRTMMIVHWLNFFGQWLDDRGPTLPPDTLDWALDALPLDHQVWAVASHELERVLYVLGAARAGTAANRLVANSPYPAVVLAALHMKLEWGRDEMPEAEVLALLEQMDAVSSTANITRIAHGEFDPRRPWAAGQPLPDFDYGVLEPGDGPARISSGQLAGKPSLVMFWAEHCGPCVFKMHEIHAAYAACNGQDVDDPREVAPVDDPDVRFLSIGWQTTPQSVQAFREAEWPMPWTHVVLDDAQNDRIMSDWYLMGVPTYALVDAQGTIIADDDDFLRSQPTILEAMRAHGVCKPQR